MSTLTFPSSPTLEADGAVYTLSMQQKAGDSEEEADAGTSGDAGHGETQRRSRIPKKSFQVCTVFLD